MIKNLVLDTNVLIHDPEAVFKFDDNDVYIPIFVIEEIDKFKKEGTERGRNCRHFCRILDGRREKSSKPLSLGASLGTNLGNLYVYVPSVHDHKESLDHGAQDRAILSVAIEIRDRDIPKKTVFITMDTNLRIRADAIGMESETYENSRTDTETSSSVIEIGASESSIIELFSTGETKVSVPDGLRPNSSVMLTNFSNPLNTALARYDSSTNTVKKLSYPKDGVTGIRPKNREQSFALDLLLDDKIQIVTLVGKAGTGKTLLAIAAGLSKIQEGVYTRMLVSRPVMPLGKDIGFLPGSVDEKLAPWMQPIFDNLEFLFSKGKKVDSEAYKELLSTGVIQVEPLTYIRGRSLPYQYIVIDECQNLSPHEIKTIVTRAGIGSKIILTGDPEQIDNPYVDASSNGLSVVADKFREQIIAGHVVLTRGERSELAELASRLM